MAFLPPNIDLTEHRDFGHGSTIVEMDIVIDIPLGEYHNMSLDQYEFLKWKERFFGRSGHYTESMEVFNQEETYMKRIQRECAMCGKQFRIPWDNISGVCKQCDSKLKNRIPWNEYYGQPQPWHDTKFDLFNSR